MITESSQYAKVGNLTLTYQKERETQQIRQQTTYGEIKESYIVSVSGEEVFQGDETAAKSRFEQLKSELHPLIGCIIAPKVQLSIHTKGIKIIERVTEDGVYAVVDRTSYPGDFATESFISNQELEAYTIGDRHPDGYRYIQHLRLCW